MSAGVLAARFQFDRCGASIVPLPQHGRFLIVIIIKFTPLLSHLYSNTTSNQSNSTHTVFGFNKQRITTQHISITVIILCRRRPSMWKDYKIFCIPSVPLGTQRRPDYLRHRRSCVKKSKEKK